MNAVMHGTSSCARTAFSSLLWKAITPTLWERAGVMADREGLTSLRSVHAGFQNTSSGILLAKVHRDAR